MADDVADDVLVVESLVRRFGDLVAVDDVSFRIGHGETYGLLGPNGAGKTTTISMVAGLIAADAGTVTVAGQPMTPRSTEPKRHLGLVPQELAIYPDLTARENLVLFGRLQGLHGGGAAGHPRRVVAAPQPGARHVTSMRPPVEGRCLTAAWLAWRT